MIGQTVSHYRILSKLGGGGMGLVYEAEDVRLGRRVALKFLPEEFANDPTVLQRFQREARSASALNHPNICVIHDIGEHDGHPFIAMEMMKGQTLKYLIGGKPMEIDQTIDLSIEIADALDAAHSEGIIHRDIKPANVFVTDRGHAKLLDFGLAKQTMKDAAGNSEQPTASVQEPLTKSGSTLGTVAYMSPEQARGKDLDPRTDLFSFGAVLFEMLTGVLPFVGQNAGELLEAIFTKQPVAPVRLNQNVPAELERIIYKALEKDRNLRYQSAKDIRTDLQRLKRDTSTSTSRTQSTKEKVTGWRRLAILGAVLFVLGIVIVIWLNQKPKTASTKQIITSQQSPTPSIAVLPFVNMSEDKTQEYFSDGLTEELLNNLAKIPGLRVTGRTSSFQFRGKGEDLRVIGRKLNVTTILEGSVRKDANRVPY